MVFRYVGSSYNVGVVHKYPEYFFADIVHLFTPERVGSCLMHLCDELQGSFISYAFWVRQLLK